MIAYLIHDSNDSVGVAVTDLKAGDTYRGRYLRDDGEVTVEVKSEIPLGHKVALQDFAEGDTVIKYGVDIGKIVKPVKKGEHVHVHNLKTKRW